MTAPPRCTGPSYRDDLESSRSAHPRRRQRERCECSGRHAAVDRQRKQKRRDRPVAARCRSQPERRPGERRNGSDDGVALRAMRTSCEQLAAKGANLNARGTRGQTALMWAASQKHPDVTKVLLAHGADVHARSESWSQVMAVPPHVWRALQPRDPARRQHGACCSRLASGDLESAKMLVAAGANVNDEDAWGVSATTLAAHSGFGDLVEFLLEKGADPNASKRRLHGSARRDPAPRRKERERASRARRRCQRAAAGVDSDAPLVGRFPFPSGVDRRDAALARRPFQPRPASCAFW